MNKIKCTLCLLLMVFSLESCNKVSSKLKSIVGVEETYDDPEDALKAEVKSLNLQFPMQMDEATTMTELSIEEKYVVYHAMVDENIVSIYSVLLDKENFKNGILQNYRTNVDAMRSFLDCCRNTNRGIAYKYVGKSSGSEALITIEVDELP